MNDHIEVVDPEALVRDAIVGDAPALPASPAKPTTYATSERSKRRVVAGIAFALTPWLSIGFATPIAFILVAVLFRRLGKVAAAVLWISAAVYTIVLIAELLLTDSGGGTHSAHA